jgi:ribonucleotide monophosphatase NagD (HAD superfamily)
MNNQTLYIFDLDGVLFDNSHRQHLLPKGDGRTTEQWDAFNLACEGDAPIMHMWQLMVELLRNGHTVRFLTGRSEVCRAATVRAIRKVSVEVLRHDVLVANSLIMRPVDDHRPAHEFKRDVVQLLSVCEDRRLVLVDDDLRIIEACGDLVDEVIQVIPFIGCVGLPASK